MPRRVSISMPGVYEPDRENGSAMRAQLPRSLGVTDRASFHNNTPTHIYRRSHQLTIARQIRTPFTILLFFLSLQELWPLRVPRVSSTRWAYSRTSNWKGEKLILDAAATVSTISFVSSSSLLHPSLFNATPSLSNTFNIYDIDKDRNSFSKSIRLSRVYILGLCLTHLKRF